MILLSVRFAPTGSVNDAVLLLSGLSAAALAGTFLAWYRTQRTLDVHSVDRPAHEVFYWLSVLFTFALGTAMGDFTSVTLGLGTLTSTVVFLGVIALPAIGYRRLGVSGVLAFWLAYTITRPLGASFADWLGVPAPYGDGLGIGTSTTSAIFGAVLVSVVTVIGVRHHRMRHRSRA